MLRPQSPERVHTAPWQVVTSKELKGFWLVDCNGDLSHTSLSCFWSTDLVWNSPVFLASMSRDRFMSILNFLQVVDNRTQNTLDTISDSLRKLRSFIDTIL